MKRTFKQALKKAENDGKSLYEFAEGLWNENQDLKENVGEGITAGIALSVGIFKHLVENLAEFAKETEQRDE